VFSAEILFDSALPSSKTQTRLSRLNDSLRKLTNYRSANPTIRHGAQSIVESPETFFADETSKAAFVSRTQPLSAPPFIVAAALSWLSSHNRYRDLTKTVPGEADPFLAAAAIRNGGIVLTGDSDLLVFGDDVDGWGVVMLQDLVFTEEGVMARVSRPADVARALKYPLLHVAYQTALDSSASLGQILDRLGRIETRRRQGAAVESIPAAFVREYSLPAEGGAVRMVEEPRIGELLFLAAKGKTDRRMYFPFLNEDPQRAPAWEIGCSTRALAYSLLFGGGEVKEVFRRGSRITESPVLCENAAKKLEEFAGAVADAPETSWWVVAVLDGICSTMKGRNQPVLSPDELAATAAILLPNPGFTPPKETKHKWNWRLVHIFAMAQAGWYSLLLLREVLRFITIRDTPVFGDVRSLEALHKSLLQLPDILDLLDGRVFLFSFEKPTEKAKAVARYVLELRWRAVKALETEETAISESPTNENGKQPSDGAEEKRGGVDSWEVVEYKKAKPEKKRRGTLSNSIASDFNKFAVLAADM